MKPCLHPSHALCATMVILAITIRFPVIWCQPYDVCGQSVRCGNFKLEYPFWGLSRPAYCGRLGFQLTCQSNVPLLTYGSVEYRVLGIDSSTQTINISRNDLWSTFCPQRLQDTIYNSSLFSNNIFGQENVFLYYSCDTSIAGGILLQTNHQFSCDASIPDSNQRNINYFFRNSLINLVQCSNHITVPVNQSWADRLATGNATTSDLRSALTAGFKLLWMANNYECSQCIQSGGRCGSNLTSLALFTCHCSHGNFPLSCNQTIKNGGSRGEMRKLIIGISSGITVVMIVLFVTLYRKKRLLETRKATDHQIEIFLRSYGSSAPKRYKYSEIKKMTKSFLEKVGQGGYGSVYRGGLSDGRVVAVKLLSEASGDGGDFINEVVSISKTSHVNIVTLLGFCIERKKRVLLYEFMPNGSLDKFLRVDGSHLDWNTLFKIAKGIARGLEYLHQGCNTRIVHFDIKPHNILLDEEFVPKISDFGLAKLCKKRESIVSVMGARGTVGYMAPEVFLKSLGGASHKSDVYSYGMMVLEMIGAHKSVNAALTSASEEYFPNGIYRQVEAGENLGVHGLTNKVEEELARKMATVSLWCIQSDPSDRPSISKVVEMLEGSFESLQVPPRRFWSSPVRSVPGTSPSATQSSTSEGLSVVVQAIGEDFSS